MCLCLPLSLHSLHLSFKKTPHAFVLLIFQPQRPPSPISTPLHPLKQRLFIFQPQCPLIFQPQTPPHPRYQLLPHTNDLPLKQRSFLTRIPLLNSLSQAISLPPFKTTLPLSNFNISSSPQNNAPSSSSHNAPSSSAPLPFKGNTFLLNKTPPHHPQTTKRAIRSNEDTFLIH